MAPILWEAKLRIRKICSRPSKIWPPEQQAQEKAQIRSNPKETRNTIRMKGQRSSIGYGFSSRWSRPFTICISTWWAMSEQASGRPRLSKRLNRERVARRTCQAQIYLTFGSILRRWARKCLIASSWKHSWKDRPSLCSLRTCTWISRKESRDSSRRI